MLSHFLSFLYLKWVIIVEPVFQLCTPLCWVEATFWNKTCILMYIHYFQACIDNKVDLIILALANKINFALAWTKGILQGRAETFGGAGAQSIKGAHGARLLIGLCSLLICVSKWMLLYWYSSKCHDAGLKKKHRTEKTILSLNVKDIFCTS